MRGLKDLRRFGRDLAMVCIVALATLAVPGHAEGLIDNVNGYTLDAKGRLVRFAALLIGKDGRVAKLLDKGDKPPKTLDFKLDANGKTLMPGLIDPGIRLMEAALAATPRDPSLAGRPIQPRERDAAFTNLQAIFLARGITSVTDLNTTITDWEVYRRAGDAGRLRIRILSYAAGIETMMIAAGNQPTQWLYNGRLRMAGLSVIDQTPLDDARVRNLASRGAMDDFQIAIEPVGEGALDHSIAAIDEVAETYKGDRRWRLQLGSTPALSPERLAKSEILAMSPPDTTLANLATSFAARTRDAARAAFAEDQVGTLVPGSQADFLLFDRDVIAAPPAEAAAARLLETWIGGVRVWVGK